MSIKLSSIKKADTLSLLNQALMINEAMHNVPMISRLKDLSVSQNRILNELKTRYESHKKLTEE